MSDAACTECTRLTAEVKRLRYVVSTTAFHLRRGDHENESFLRQILDAHDKALVETARPAPNGDKSHE